MFVGDKCEFKLTTKKGRKLFTVWTYTLQGARARFWDMWYQRYYGTKRRSPCDFHECAIEEVGAGDDA